ncbi:MAG: SEL1-like repeat protein [Bradymonadaceae bacterium]|nr:SEL1-like repeat protein [Lujinxingiaceae bacterium]
MICARCGALVNDQVTFCSDCGSNPVLEGRYRLEEIVGQSATSATYRATDVIDGLVVTVKAMTANSEHAQGARSRFLREARSLRQLRHGGIAAHVNSFAVERGTEPTFYIVEEFVQGQSLAEELAGHHYAELEALIMARELLRIAAYLHGLHPALVHGAIEPANVMRRRSDHGFMLIDFECVRAALLGPGRRLQSAFIAPEQLRGEPAGEASDVFGIGATALALIHGGALGRDDRMNLDWRGRVNLSAPASALIARMVADEPGERISARAAVLELDALLGERPLGPPRKRHPSLLPDYARVPAKANNAALFVMIGVMGLAVLIGGVLAMSTTDSENPVEDVVDFHAAQRINFLRLCVVDKQMPACNSLGWLHAQGLGGLASSESAATYYEMACEGGDAQGCHYLGHHKMAAPELDYASARLLFDRSCQGHFVDGCVSLAWLYESGLGGAVDVQRAREMYESACERHQTRACTNLGWMYAQGIGGSPDLDKGLRLLQKACQADDASACYRVGWLYAQVRDDITQDLDFTRRMYQKACSGGDLEACTAQGWLLENGMGGAQDVAQALSLYERACNGLQMTGCSNLGWFYAAGKHVARDLSRGIALLEQSCNGNYMSACNNLGWIYSQSEWIEHNFARAHAWFERGCAGEDLSSCTSLGWLYTNGHGVAIDFVRARTLFEPACASNIMPACMNLGWLYGGGHGVELDAARSTGYYQRACAGGEERACVALQK